MNVIVTLGGKRYTITSDTVAGDVLHQAAALLGEAVVAIEQKHGMLSEGQLCVAALMHCLVPLLEEQHRMQRAVTDLLAVVVEANHQSTV